MRGDTVSLRWHYPEQVPGVDGRESCAHPLSRSFSSPNGRSGRFRGACYATSPGLSTHRSSARLSPELKLQAGVIEKVNSPAGSLCLRLYGPKQAFGLRTARTREVKLLLKVSTKPLLKTTTHALDGMAAADVDGQ